MLVLGATTIEIKRYSAGGISHHEPVTVYINDDRAVVTALASAKPNHNSTHNRNDTARSGETIFTRGQIHWVITCIVKDSSTSRRTDTPTASVAALIGGGMQETKHKVGKEPDRLV